VNPVGRHSPPMPMPLAAPRGGFFVLSSGSTAARPRAAGLPSPESGRRPGSLPSDRGSGPSTGPWSQPRGQWHGQPWRAIAVRHRGWCMDQGVRGRRCTAPAQPTGMLLPGPACWLQPGFGDCWDVVPRTAGDARTCDHSRGWMKPNRIGRTVGSDRTHDHEKAPPGRGSSQWLGGDLNSRPWGYESHALTS